MARGDTHAGTAEKEKEMEKSGVNIGKVNQPDYIPPGHLLRIISIYVRRFRTCNRPRPRNASSHENIKHWTEG